MINKAIILLACMLLVGLGIYYQLHNNTPADIEDQIKHATYLYDQKTAIANYELTDHNNNFFTPESIKGKWTFWFFGFTHCPDICPTTLSTLAATLEKLKTKHNIKQDIKIIFVSVDPKRDDIDTLKTYVTTFSNDAIGVTASEKKLAPFLKNMGIIAVKRDDNGQLSDYLVDHSSSIILIAPDTSISAYFGTPHEVEAIVQDFLTILKLYP